MAAPVITLSSRSNDGFVITYTGGDSSPYEVEINREADFASDDSIKRTGMSASPITFTALPSGTPFYVRMRSTNASFPTWSNVLLTSTTAVTLDTSYAGFSHDKAMVVVPEDLNNIVCTGAAAGFPGSNLLRDDPMSQCRYQTSGGDMIITFETSGAPVDVIALLGTFLNKDALWRIRSSATSSFTSPAYDTGSITARVSPTLGRRPSYHCMLQLPAPRTETFWRIDIAPTSTGAANAPTMLARNLVVGLARMSVNASRGAGWEPNDGGAVSRNRFGTPDRVRGWRGRSLDLELSWINEAEYQAKYADLDLIIGTTKPALIVQNSKRNVMLQDRMGFGEIRQMRGENVRARRFLKSLQCSSIY